MKSQVRKFRQMYDKFQEQRESEKIHSDFFTAAYDGNLYALKSLIPRVAIDSTNKTFLSFNHATLGRTAAFFAAENGHAKIIDALYEAKADLDKGDDKCWTPACVAAQNSHVDVISSLHAAGADLNKQNIDGFTPLMIAVQNNNLKVVSVLCAAKADPDKVDSDGVAAIHIAAYYGYVEVIEALREAGANINIPNDDGITPLMISQKDNHEKISDILKKYLTEDEEQGKATSEVKPTKEQIAKEQKAKEQRIKAKEEKAKKKQKELDEDLLKAVLKGDSFELESLISKGANYNIADTIGNLPIHFAAQKGHVAIIKALHKAGADMNVANIYGYTPGCYAAKNGHMGAIKALHDEGADMNIANYNKDTPACFAARHSLNTRVIRALFAADADMDIPNNEGETPIFIAAEEGHEKIVETLRDVGANITIPNKKGKTPLIIAMEKENTEVIEILKQYIAEDEAKAKQQSQSNTPPLPSKQEQTPTITKMQLPAEEQKQLDEALVESIQNFEVGVYEIENLIKRGADVNTQDKDGQTPTYFAVSHCRDDVVKLLRKYGASLGISNNDGNQLITIASYNDHGYLCELLKQYIAEDEAKSKAKDKFPEIIKQQEKEEKKVDTNISTPISPLQKETKKETLQDSKTTNPSTISPLLQKQNASEEEIELTPEQKKKLAKIADSHDDETIKLLENLKDKKIEEIELNKPKLEKKFIKISAKKILERQEELSKHQKEIANRQDVIEEKVDTLDKKTAPAVKREDKLSKKEQEQLELQQIPEIKLFYNTVELTLTGQLMCGLLLKKSVGKIQRVESGAEMGVRYGVAVASGIFDIFSIFGGSIISNVASEIASDVTSHIVDTAQEKENEKVTQTVFRPSDIEAFAELTARRLSQLKPIQKELTSSKYIPEQIKEVGNKAANLIYDIIEKGNLVEFAQANLSIEQILENMVSAAVDVVTNEASQGHTKFKLFSKNETVGNLFKSVLVFTEEKVEDPKQETPVTLQKTEEKPVTPSNESQKTKSSDNHLFKELLEKHPRVETTETVNVGTPPSSADINAETMKLVVLEVLKSLGMDFNKEQIETIERICRKERMAPKVKGQEVRDLKTMVREVAKEFQEKFKNLEQRDQNKNVSPSEFRKKTQESTKPQALSHDELQKEIAELKKANIKLQEESIRRDGQLTASLYAKSIVIAVFSELNCNKEKKNKIMPMVEEAVTKTICTTTDLSQHISSHANDDNGIQDIGASLQKALRDQSVIYKKGKGKHDSIQPEKKLVEQSVKNWADSITKQVREKWG